MRTAIEGDRIIACLEGRIDSSNAPELKEALSELMAQNPGRTLEIDAQALDYISSAGLRALLQARKAQGALTVRDVSPEVYEILDMTGFTSLLTVKKRLRRISVEGCPVVGRGAIGTVYRVDEDTVVKVYEIPDSLPMIENEQKRAKQAFMKGIPTAISYDVVRVGDKYGSVFEMLKASTYNDLILRQPDRLDEFIRQYARFIRDLHTVEMDRGELPQARDIFLGYLDALGSLLPEALSARLRGLLLAMPENLHAVHGEIQMKNLMLSGDEPLLIDMDTLCMGDPVFDMVGLYVAYRQFSEDDPNDSMTFFGVPKEVAVQIWDKTLRYYLEGAEESALRAAEEKIVCLAQVRFLYIITVLDIGIPELKQQRVRHSIERLEALVDRVDTLAIG